MSITFTEAAINYWHSQESRYKRAANNTTDEQTKFTYLNAASKARRICNEFINYTTKTN